MFNKLTKTFLKIGFWTFISRIFGFFRDILLAAALGAGFLSDVFFVAFKLPNMFRRLTAEGALVQSFLPQYILVKNRETNEQAKKFSSEVQSAIIFVLLLIVIIFEIFMGLVVSILAPGFKDDPQKFQMTIKFATITITYLPMVSLMALWGAIAQASGSFFPLAAAPIILNLTLISGSVLIISKLVDPIFLALMVPFAGILQLIFVGLWIKKLGFFPHYIILKLTNKTKRVWKKFLPASLGAGLLQLNLLVDTILATLVGSGAVSFLYYADRVAQLPLGIIGIALGTALLPSLSDAEDKKDLNYISSNLINAIKIGAIFSIPACISFIILPSLLVEVIFARGAFLENEIKNVSLALSAYGIGVPAFVFIKILQSSFFAMGDTSTPFKVSALSVFFNIILSYLLMRFFGHFGIALATSIVAYFVLFILFIILFKKKRLSIEIFKPLFVIIILILPFTIVLISVYNLINNINLNIYLSLILLIFLVSVIWFFLVYICGLVKFN